MKSILVSNLNNLGDVICGTAALDLLRQRFPDARIGLMVRPVAQELMRGHPAVDDLFVHNYKSGSGAGAIRKMAAEIRPKRYDTFINLDRRFRSAAIAVLAGIKTRVTPATLHPHSKPKWWMPLLGGRVIPYPENHFDCLVEQFTDPIRKALNIEGDGKIAVAPISPENRALAAELLAPAGTRPSVGFSVRAEFAGKNWLPGRFAELMDRLAASHNPYLYITGTVNDADYANDVAGRCRLATPVNLAGRTSPAAIVAMASMSRLFITLDTGAVHMAGASGLKEIICIVACTTVSGIRRSVPTARMFSTDAPCCPCTGPCPHPFEEAPCRKELGVDEVYEAAAEMLSTGGEEGA